MSRLLTMWCRAGSFLWRFCHLIPYLLLGHGIGLSGLAATDPLTFTITGSGEQSQTLSSPSGRTHKIVMNFSGRINLKPSNITCDTERFLSDAAELNGVVRVWGSATATGGGLGTEIFNFDGSVDFTWGKSSMTSKFTPQTGNDLYWDSGDGQVYIPRNQGAIYGFEYISSLNVLRVWVTLPTPFSYAEQYEHYDFPASHLVTGTNSVLTCLFGTVTNANGTPISGAKVVFGGVPRTTDAQGKFEYHDIPPASYQLTISKSNYATVKKVETISPFTILRKTYALGRRPVILVYGWHGTPENWDLIKTYLEMDGYPVRILRYDSSLGPTQAAAVLRAEVESVLSAGLEQVDIIAHSYGGLVARNFTEEMGHDKLVANLIMLATPNHGSRAADYIEGTLAEQPEAGLLEYFLDWYGALFRSDLNWGSTLALRTINNDYLDRQNLLFGARLPALTTHYFVIAGTQPYPLKFTSHRSFLPGPDDGIVAVSSARLPGVPLRCVPLNHSAIVNPRLIREWQKNDKGPTNSPELDKALDDVLGMYTGIIRPILEGTPPPADFDCANAQDPNDDLKLLDILTKLRINVHNNDVVNRTFTVEPNSSTMTVAFTHQFSEFNFSLRTPSGQTISKTNAAQFGAIFTEGASDMSYIIPNPQKGQWGLTIGVIDIPDQGEDLNIYVVSQSPESLADAPRLEATLIDSQLVLSWPVWVTGFTIESQNTLAIPNQWETFSVSPTRAGDRWILSLPTTNNSTFYRLRKK